MSKLKVTTVSPGDQPGGFLTRPEAATFARVCLSTLDREIKAGKFPHKRIRGRVLIPRGPFEDWCKSTDERLDSMGEAA